jgi:hypothetical protein
MPAGLLGGGVTGVDGATGVPGRAAAVVAGAGVGATVTRGVAGAWR